LIKLICFLSKEIENSALTRNLLKIVFIEDYNVSIAEKLIPSAEISEQISLAGKEASGTGCMKLMMNGAITLGTLDGANVEILEAAGAENEYIFGLNAREAEQLWKSGYNSRKYYQQSERLRACVDRLYKPIYGCDFSDIAKTQSLISLLEDKEDLIRMITDATDRDGLNVMIGDETLDGGLERTSCVYHKFRIGKDITGVLGLIGPKRMDYSGVIARLEYVVKNHIGDDNNLIGDERN
jgi:glucan phosphorylase